MSSSECPIVPSEGFALPLEELYPAYPEISPTYATTVSMERVYQWTYRWNSSTDMANGLLSPDATRDDKEDYLVGLLWASFALLCFFLLWFIFLVFCKLWGPSTVGFLSARRLRPPRPEEPTEALEKKDYMYRQQQRKGGVPFQHNGIASGFVPESPKKSSAAKSAKKMLVKGTIKAPKKLVKGTIKAPKKLVKATKKQYKSSRKRKKFARINSAGDIELDEYLREAELNDLYDEHEDDDNYASTSKTTPESSPDSPRQDGDSTIAGESVLLMTQEDERKLADYEIELKQYYDICERRNTRMRRVRVTVAFCALGIVVAAVLFLVMGMDSLLQSANVTANGIDRLQQQAQEVSTQPELREMVTYLDGTFQLVVEPEALQDMETDLQTLQALLDQADKYYPTTLNWTFWVAVGCNLALAVIALCICATVMLLYFGRPLPRAFRCLRSFFLIPLFLFLVVLGWAFTTVFIVGSVGAADACINSPDAAMLALLNRVEDSFQDDSVIHDFLEYFVRGCPVESAPQDLDQRVVIMTEIIVPALEEVLTAMQQIGFANLQQICGADLSSFPAIIEAMESQLCELSQSIVDLRILLQCPDWYAIYQYTVHNGVCYYSSTGFGWAASTQLVLVVLSMIILTLRVSYYQLNEVADEGSGGCVTNWCCCVETIEEEDDEIITDSDGDEDEEDDRSEYSEHSVSEGGSYEEEVIVSESERSRSTTSGHDREEDAIRDNENH
ncbi:MAG: hypothetical protein SGILL_003939 [Bacillariaceae sp.]